MLKRVLALSTILPIVMLLGVQPAAAQPPSKYCKQLLRAFAHGAQVNANALMGCQQNGTDDSSTSSGSSTAPPRGVDSKGEPCDPRKDTDCESLMHGVKPVTNSDIQAVAAQLKLPDATPRFGPDPSVNEWKMLAVGYPIWLWTDRPTQLTTSAHHDGMDFTLTATWTSTTFTMGDGHTKTCSATSIRPTQIKPATTPSPNCGYVYQTRSKPGHPYTVTAATHWRIDWATNGYTGTFTHTYTGSRTLDIGELQSLING